MGRLDHLLVCGCTQSECEGPPLALRQVLAHALGTAGATACAAGEGDFKAEVLLLKLSEAVEGGAWGICWQVGWFFPVTGGSFACSKAGREGRREWEQEFCPTRLQQLSLSAQPQSFSSPASPVRSGDWSTHILSQSPKMSRFKHLGAVQRLDPGLSRLQAGSCEQHGDGSLAMPAASQVTALGLGLLVLPLICSTFTFLL